MTKRLVFALALAMSPSMMLPAQPPPPPFEMMKNLDLTEAQRQSIQAIFEKHRASQQLKQQALKTKEQALMDAMAEPATTEAQLKDLHGSASEARLSMLLEGRTIRMEIQAVLTPVQQEKAKEQRQKMQKAMDAHRAAMEELGGKPERPCGPFMP